MGLDNERLTPPATDPPWRTPPASGRASLGSRAESRTDLRKGQQRQQDMATMTKHVYFVKIDVVNQLQLLMYSSVYQSLLNDNAFNMHPKFHLV